MARRCGHQVPLPATGTASSGSGARRVASGFVCLRVDFLSTLLITARCPPHVPTGRARILRLKAVRMTYLHVPPASNVLITAANHARSRSSSLTAARAAGDTMPRQPTASAYQSMLATLFGNAYLTGCQSQLLRAGCATCSGCTDPSPQHYP
jgi:hypothetical protein